jgi:hypothetical protein
MKATAFTDLAALETEVEFSALKWSTRRLLTSTDLLIPCQIPVILNAREPNHLSTLRRTPLSQPLIPMRVFEPLSKPRSKIQKVRWAITRALNSPTSSQLSEGNDLALSTRRENSTGRFFNGFLRNNIQS